MKLKRFGEFVNEELSPETYKSAAEKLDKLGQREKAHKMRKHSATHKNPIYEIETDWLVRWTFDEEGETVYNLNGEWSYEDKVFPEVNRTTPWVNVEPVLFKNCKYNDSEYFGDNEFNMSFYSEEAQKEFSPKARGDFFVLLKVENDKVVIAGYNEGGKDKVFVNKLANRKSANEFVRLLEELYKKDEQFKKFIKEHISGSDNRFDVDIVDMRSLVNIRSLYGV